MNQLTNRMDFLKKLKPHSTIILFKKKTEVETPVFILIGNSII